jgi:hypothetical protein
MVVNLPVQNFAGQGNIPEQLGHLAGSEGKDSLGIASHTVGNYRQKYLQKGLQAYLLPQDTLVYFIVSTLLAKRLGMNLKELKRLRKFGLHL